MLALNTPPPPQFTFCMHCDAVCSRSSARTSFRLCHFRKGGAAIGIDLMQGMAWHYEHTWHSLLYCGALCL